MKNILCYCEANNRTGYGHYSRIQELVTLIRNKYKKCKFFIFSKNKTEAKIYFKDLTILNTNEKFFTHCKKKKNFYDLIILDPPYYENKKFTDHLELKKIFFIKEKKFKLLRLTDETFPSNHFCDFLINDYPPSKIFSSYYKRNNKKIKLFLGIDFFLFPLSIIKKYKNIKKKYDLLIVFGGSDRKNLVYKYFKSLKKLNLEKIFILNKNIYKKIKNIKKIKKTTILKYSSKTQFFKKLAQSRNYLSTPSNIMFEGFSLNVKGNVVPIERRQQDMGKSFQKKGLVKCLPFYKSLSPEKLTEVIDFNIKSKYKFQYKKIIKLQDKLITTLFNEYRNNTSKSRKQTN